jgi:putative PIN family toxin of toxin-antitoxin system
LLEDVLTHHELIISDFILDEIWVKLREKFQFPKTEIAELRRFLIGAGTLVEPAEIEPGACRDSEDVAVLGTAIAGTVDLLISVDKDLLVLGSFRGIDIVKPGEFWRRTT